MTYGMAFSVIYNFTDGCPHHYLNEGPDVVDEGAGEQHVDDDQHDKTEDIQGQAAELLVLHSIVSHNNQYHHHQTEPGGGRWRSS